MKLRTGGFLSALLLLLTAFSAYGASLSLQPDNISITVEAGQASTPVPLTVQMEATRRGLVFVEFANEVTGDIEGWIETSPMGGPMKLVGNVYSLDTTVTVSPPRVRLPALIRDV